MSGKFVGFPSLPAAQALRALFEIGGQRFFLIQWMIIWQEQ